MVDQKTVGVMHLRAKVPVIRSRGFAMPKHTRERGDPQRLDRVPREEHRFHMRNRSRTGPDHKPVDTRDARAVEQRIDHNLLGIRRGSLDPKFLEYGKLLAAGLARIDCQAPRRQAVKGILTKQPEITRALERPNFITRPVQWVKNPKPRKPHRLGHATHLRFAVVEKLRRKRYRRFTAAP
jgi:hypothetical protein